MAISLAGTLFFQVPTGEARGQVALFLGLTMLPFAIVAGFFVPGPVWLAVAWLGPALALVPVMMALSSFVGPRVGAAAVTAGASMLRPLMSNIVISGQCDAGSH